MTPVEMRAAVAEARALVGGVVEALRRNHPGAFAGVRLSIRVLASALVVLDRAVAELAR